LHTKPEKQKKKKKKIKRGAPWPPPGAQRTNRLYRALAFLPSHALIAPCPSRAESTPIAQQSPKPRLDSFGPIETIRYTLDVNLVTSSFLTGNGPKTDTVLYEER